MSSDETILERLQDGLEAHPVARDLVTVLVDLLPGASGAQAVLMTRATRLRADRMRALFDDLRESGELSEELIESDQFLHCFVAAAAASGRTARREKIRLFANLLRGTIDGRVPSVDAFEERCLVLDELSPRELEALALLAQFEEANPPADPGQPGSAAAAYWGDLKRAFSARLGIPEEEVAAFLHRLQRSGLYETLEGLWGGNVERLGRLTSAFPSFRRSVELENRRLEWPFTEDVPRHGRDKER